MHAIIGTASPACKTAQIADGSAYFDTIEISSPRLFAIELLNELRAELKRRVWPEPVGPFGHRLIVNRPTVNAIHILERHWHRRMSIFRTHLAIDFDERPGVPKPYVEHVLRNAIHLKYRRDDDALHDHEGTQYWIRTKGRKSRPYRNLKFYPAEFGDLDGECDKLHLEIMLERKRSVQSFRIDRPRDLLNVKPRGLFKRFCTVRDQSDILETIVQRSIDAIKPHPLYNVERRLRQTVIWTGLYNVTVFKKWFGRQFERLQEWECLVIGPDLQWVKPVKGAVHQVGELRPLLQANEIKPRIRRERLIIRERLESEGPALEGDGNRRLRLAGSRPVPQ
jgi:hypothetical protein